MEIKITNVSNPYCWYADKIGYTFVVEWWSMWGCYIVVDRIGMHSDDMKIRAKDCEVVKN